MEKALTNDGRMERAAEIAAKGRGLEGLLRRNLIDKEHEAKLLTLSLMLGKNAVLIGEPGTAKTEMTTRVGKLVSGNVFSIQLTRDTDTSEIIGYFDPKLFRDEGNLVRNTKGTLLVADIAVLDEVFEANSIVLNAIRSATNEGVFYDHGIPYKLPLWSTIGSSNIIPEDPRLAGLYDRFLFRGFVQRVGATGKTIELLKAGGDLDLERLVSDRTSHAITIEELKEFRTLVDKLADAVFPLPSQNGEASPALINLIQAFTDLETVGVVVSDRRRVQIRKAIVANAILEGRTSANESDINVIRYIVPSNDDEVGKTNEVLRTIVPTSRMSLQDLQSAADGILRVIDVGIVNSEMADYLKEGIDTFKKYADPSNVETEPRVREFAKSKLNDITSALSRSQGPEFERLKLELGMASLLRDMPPC